MSRARRCEHSPQPGEPRGYLAWHEWAEEYLITHDQRQCEKCGLWKIWEPKS